MRLSNCKVPPCRTDEPPERERVDRVSVVVVVAFVTFCLVRCVIPAVIDGAQVGMAALAFGFMLLALGITLLPAWRGRRARRALGRLVAPPR
jgi:hypothetical protein